jgi:hypothetical protein
MLQRPRRSQMHQHVRINTLFCFDLYYMLCFQCSYVHIRLIIIPILFIIEVATAAPRLTPLEEFRRQQRERWQAADAEAQRVAGNYYNGVSFWLTQHMRVAPMHAEAKKIEDAAEAKKVADAAEAKKIADAAEAKKVADAAEAKKIADAAEAKKIEALDANESDMVAYRKAVAGWAGLAEVDLFDTFQRQPSASGHSRDVVESNAQLSHPDKLCSHHAESYQHIQGPNGSYKRYDVILYKRNAYVLMNAVYFENSRCLVYLWRPFITGSKCLVALALDDFLDLDSQVQHSLTFASNSDYRSSESAVVQHACAIAATSNRSRGKDRTDNMAEARMGEFDATTSLSELKKLCKLKELPQWGSKTVLIKRLRSTRTSDNDDGSQQGNGTEGESEEEDDLVILNSTQARKAAAAARKRAERDRIKMLKTMENVSTQVTHMGNL